MTHTLAPTSTSAEETRLITPTEWDSLRPARKRASASTEAELTDLGSGNSAFAFDLYRTLAAKDRNLFYSPYSISMAIAMTYAGARGQTERQMADTLRILLPQDALHSTFNTLDREPTKALPCSLSLTIGNGEASPIWWFSTLYFPAA